METYLTLDNQLRTETDSTIITNLIRKGWEYAPDKPSNDATWQDGQWVIPPPPPPVVVSFRALAFALLQARLYEQVKTAALATTEGEIWWNTAQSTTVQRDHPFVIALATAIGQTPEQIDAIFASAFASQSSQN